MAASVLRPSRSRQIESNNGLSAVGFGKPSTRNVPSSLRYRSLGNGTSPHAGMRSGSSSKRTRVSLCSVTGYTPGVEPGSSKTVSTESVTSGEQPRVSHVSIKTTRSGRFIAMTRLTEKQTFVFYQVRR